MFIILCMHMYVGVLISPPPMATNTSITIEWDLAEVLYCGPISSYILTIMNSTFMNTTRSTLSRFKFTGLMSNTSYNISVAAVNRAGTGLESNITVATITDEEEGNNVWCLHWLLCMYLYIYSQV